MPDVAVPYTLVTPAGTLVFNDGSADQFYIQSITGLDGPPIRAPGDPISYGDGGHSYNFWIGAREMLFEGIFLVTSVPVCPEAVAIWNTMEETLITILRSIAATDADTGSLTWTPTGLSSSRTLTVRNDITVECAPDQGFLVRAWHFGLRADNPDWV